MRERHGIRIGSALAAASLVLVLGACGDDEDGAGSAEATAEATAEASGDAITVADAWSRQPAEGQTVTAVYGIVSNPTDEDVTIVSAFTPVTDRVELHETIANDDGTMTMQQKEGGFVVPAGGEFTFESGGPHIMLFDIDPATYPTSVDVTLTFDSGDPILFTAEVRAIDESMDMSMDMGSEMSADMSGAEMSGDHDHAVDASALHDIDEALKAGTLDAATQRPVVAEAIEALEADGMPAADTPEAALLAILMELDAALEAGDLDAASAAATAAHDASHELEEHHDG
jgi:periplasmic copper chaperone A